MVASGLKRIREVEFHPGALTEYHGSSKKSIIQVLILSSTWYQLRGKDGTRYFAEFKFMTFMCFKY
jgi:hypothetical protein